MARDGGLARRAMAGSGSVQEKNGNVCACCSCEKRSWVDWVSVGNWVGAIHCRSRCMCHSISEGLGPKDMLYCLWQT